MNLLPILLFGLVSASPQRPFYPKLVGNLVYDGSEIEVQKFIDSFHKAVQSGSREEIARHFYDFVILETCEPIVDHRGRKTFKHYNRTTLIDYLTINGSNVRMQLAKSQHSERRNAEKYDTIVAALVITGMGEPFRPIMQFQVVNGSLQYMGAEASDCKFWRPDESVGDGSMSVAYDFLDSFANSMKNRGNEEAIAEHFSDRWSLKNCNDGVEISKANISHTLSTFPMTHWNSFSIFLYKSQFVNKKKIQFEAAFYNLRPFANKEKNFTIIAENGKFQFESVSDNCGNVY